MSTSAESNLEARLDHVVRIATITPVHGLDADHVWQPLLRQSGCCVAQELWPATLSSPASENT
ncbi:MAG: hypothetical protein Q7V20_16490 [Aquabacterium sp.]|uniref:hypothetical protein n=1 Tax=Aquabacterium sp. TaxID=1872578 RepID=UPI00271CD2E5|nr:hypothetical protein [Aquabacterium sp.]MDO9005043.1 hypothetical protein [Aquabacterium sp.]